MILGETDVMVFLQSGGDELAEECRRVSDRVKVVTGQSLEDDPRLEASVEVIYGRLAPERWPSFPALKWLQLAGAGADGLLTPAVVESGVTITNASGIHAAPITEHMFGLLLAHNRRLFKAWDLQGQGKWGAEGLGHNLPVLEGKTLGLLGLGRIGVQSARVGRAFGMRVIGLRRSSRPEEAVDQVYGLERLHEFLEESDVVMNTLPLTPESRGLLGVQALAAMREGSVLINTGRGGTIDTAALVNGLQCGRPAAAILDVTDPEPLPEGHPLWSMENVVITPHIAGSHADYALNANRIFLDNLARYLNRHPLVNIVNKETGY